MQIAQLIAIGSTLVLFVINALLALFLTKFYIKDKSISYLIWSSGFRFFAIAVLLELLFAFGVYSSFLASVYLFSVAMPLLAFSIGHMQFVKSKKLKQSYYYYCIAISLVLLYFLFSSGIGNIFNGYVVYGNLPLSVTIFSWILGISASVVLFVIAITNYLKKKDLKMLAIIPGVILFFLNDVVHFAAVSPVLLYYYQLLGIILIWLGIVGFLGVKEYPQL